MPFLLIFIVLPLLELFVLIQVGSVIGAGWTVLLVILSAVLGVAVMRRQGMAALADLQSGMEDLRDPVRPIAHGVLIMLAGLLLIVPGFLTDAVGVALLIPPLRDWLLRRMGRRVVVVDQVQWGMGARRTEAGPGGRVIDAEYEVVEDEGPTGAGPQGKGGTSRPPSGWTRG